MSTADEPIEWEDDEPDVTMEDPIEDEATVSDWLSRKLQRELEEFIRQQPGNEVAITDEITRQAEYHALPVMVVGDLAKAGALRLSAQERIRANMGK